MRISIVLLTCNAGAKFRPVLEILRRQQIAAELEYVAVDSGSTDGTREALADFGFQVASVDKGRFAYGPVRDLAFRLCSGDIMVTQSQDVLPADESYVQSMTEAILGGAADVVQGVMSSPPQDDNVFIWDRTSGLFYFTSEGRRFMRSHGHIGLSCACLALSRKAWEATGFGDCAYCEDKFIQKRLVEKGFRIVRTSRVVAWHGHPYSLSSLVRRCLNEGFGWRSAGVRYSTLACLRDLTVGFARNLPAWWRAVWSGQARCPASVLFFQIRPLCVWVGNRLLRNALL